MLQFEINLHYRSPFWFKHVHAYRSRCLLLLLVFFWCHEGAMKRFLSSSAPSSSGRDEPPSSSSSAEQPATSLHSAEQPAEQLAASLRSDEQPALLTPPAEIFQQGQDIPAESRANVAFTGLPAEPDEPRMTVKGAILVVNSGGKLDVNGYMILKHLFADTVPREQHPVPSKPGVKEDEQEQTENLRWWSDAKGEGWIAKGPNMGTRTKDKWFNAHKCGSWRLAFLLAKLQRDIWLSGVHIKWAIDNA